jgi:hypothetical protein
MYQLVIKQRAFLMMQEAYDWYEKQRTGLGEEFLVELDVYFKKLEETPMFYGKIKKNYRQLSLNRFPYVIVFEIIKNEVIIFAIFHTSRNPKFKFKD